MHIELKDSLPFVSVTVAYKGASLHIPDILIDTGSCSTILSADIVSGIQLTPSPEDIIYAIRGVGGSEVVFSRTVDFLRVGEKTLSDFQIEIGGMDYGFDINGILGMDFLIGSQAFINLQSMDLRFAS